MHFQPRNRLPKLSSSPFSGQTFQHFVTRLARELLHKRLNYLSIQSCCVASTVTAVSHEHFSNS
jgi:hypothetical protein